jgi:hypothetical protein
MGQDREKGCVSLWFSSLGGGILDVISRCSASVDSESQKRGALKFTQPNWPSSRIWLLEARLFGAAPSWSDGKLESGGIPNTPLVVCKIKSETRYILGLGKMIKSAKILKF